MKLNVFTIKNAKPKDKPYKLTDGHGLCLQVMPNGSKRWRIRYYLGGEENMLSLGLYPEVDLKEARERHLEARRQLARGMCPSESRLEQKAAGLDSFEAIAREWLEKNNHMWTPGHARQLNRRLEKDIFPWIGKKVITDISPTELLRYLRRIEERGAIETTHRVKSLCGQIFRYAVASGKADRDPTQDLKGALIPVKTKHHASITDIKEIGGLLRAIDDYTGHFVTKCALKLAPLTFVRPGELRQAEWKEFDLKKVEWRIPSEKMKSRVLHIVPLSKQALTIINELKALTGNGKYLFPSIRTKQRPMSDNSINSALRRMGYAKDEMTGHGFRSMASTLLNELGWKWDAIERQLAHGERNSVRAAYNYAEYLPERKTMMQRWADYLDELKRGQNERA